MNGAHAAPIALHIAVDSLGTVPGSLAVVVGADRELRRSCHELVEVMKGGLKLVVAGDLHSVAIVVDPAEHKGSVI